MHQNIIRIDHFILNNYLKILLFLFILFFTWYEYFGYERFIDIENYNYSFYNSLFEYTQPTFIKIIFGEYLFYFILLFFSFVTDFNTFHYFISLFISLVILIFNFHQVRNVLVLILLINPLFFEICYGQLRTGLALAFFLLYIMLKDKNIIFRLFFLIPPLIHSSFFLFSFMYLFGVFFFQSKRFSFNNRLLYLTLLLLCAILFCFTKTYVLYFIGDVRYNAASTSQSLSFTLPWIIIYIILFLGIKRLSSVSFFYFSCITLFVVSFFFNHYNLRFLSVSYCAFLPVLKFVNFDFRNMVYLIFIFFNSYHWVLWLN